MPRTSIAQVQGILKTKVEIVGNDGSGLDPFMETANLQVTDLCTASGYSDARLEMIERYLSAHYYAVRDRTLQRTTQSAGDVSDGYTLGLGKGLEATQYGREAKMLDFAGNLASAEKRSQAETPKPGVTFLGTEHQNYYGSGWGC